MARENYNDLQAFLAVARERSFTRAAAQLGVSPSALSHTIRALEARLGLRLLTRTTRNVAPTEAGERLIKALTPNFEDIDTALAGLSELRDKPSGTIRITTGEHAASTILWPVLRKLLPDYPDIRIEVISDSSLTDIVAERFDAGIRLGEQVARDMIAVPIGPPMRMAVVGSPDYLASRPKVKTPRDLTGHDCINLRFLTHGGLYAWEFEKKGRPLNVRVEGRLIFNNTRHIITAARDGFGLACVPEDMVRTDIADGSLQRLLADWCPPFPGYHLYYPSRRQPSPAFSLLVDALRKRG
ncbi:LysR family transcriptional regulator [Rhodanobacter sp. FW510-R12]|uniref:LysR family transcriptional regulator n=1 Tax=unclassified Rhodanobacter TaxID=2621553 RepID=UPI0007A9E1C7|nr:MULTISPECIES: LysR family transcriptional regulator [unclassified Rhodanobacter]KZC17282.1 LysR family transcriptional regulator [Rhodanobacter sp. FW104-R8]KZC26228.1 LysR family transcriptional regulator [Rhodanobacter sp. FW510-T8]KZC29335.1 LysR family transcriptional regulator [Rhodanobacter sp. FW510-R10]